MHVLNLITSFEPLLSHFTSLLCFAYSTFWYFEFMSMKTQEKYVLSICLFQNASKFLLSQAPTDTGKGLSLDTFMTVEVKQKERLINPMVEWNCSKNYRIAIGNFSLAVLC